MSRWALLLLAVAVGSCQDFKPKRTVVSEELHELLSIDVDNVHGADVDYSYITRDESGRIFVSSPPIGVMRFPARGGSGSQLRNRLGKPVLGGGALSWLGDTLALRGWMVWTLFDDGEKWAGCRTFEQAQNEFAVQVYPMIPVAGGLAIGELLPPYQGMGIDEKLVVARGQEVVRTLSRRSALPAEIEVPFPWGGGALDISPPYLALALWSVNSTAHSIIAVDDVGEPSGVEGVVRVRRVELTGDTVYSLGIRVPALAIDSSAVDDWLTRNARAMAGGTIPRSLSDARRALREAIQFPKYYPLVDSIIAGTDGSVWLRLPSKTDSVTWLRLDSLGHEAHRTRLPKWFRPRYADADGLWGVTRRRPERLTFYVYPLSARAIPRRPLTTEAIDWDGVKPGIGFSCIE